MLNTLADLTFYGSLVAIAAVGLVPLLLIVRHHAKRSRRHDAIVKRILEG